MEFVFSYLAGLLTLLNPCVFPVLPIVLASALHASKWGPLALVLGMGAAFSIVGISIAALGPALGIDSNTVSQTGAVIMMLLGGYLMVGHRFVSPTAVFAGTAQVAEARMQTMNTNSIGGQFLGGALLGAVWSPCIGPTLGGAITLAYEQSNLAYAFAVMLTFSAGIGSVMLFFAYGARGLVTRSRNAMATLVPYAGTIIGTVFFAVGVMIFFKLHHSLEAWALARMPEWLVQFSTRF